MLTFYFIAPLLFLSKFIPSPTMNSKALDEVSSRWPIVASGLAVVLVVFFLPAFLKPDPLAGIPVVGKGLMGVRRKFLSGCLWDVYQEGYDKVRPLLGRLGDPKGFPIGSMNY